MTHTHQKWSLREGDTVDVRWPNGDCLEDATVLYIPTEETWWAFRSSDGTREFYVMEPITVVLKLKNAGQP
jgi:hypothetical protein